MSLFTDFVKNVSSTVTYAWISDQQPATKTGIEVGSLSQAINTKSKASFDLQRIDVDSMPESWVELGAPPSRGSVCSSIDALYIGNEIAPVRSGVWRSKSNNQSPNQEMELSDQMKARSIVPPGKQTDWMWDWSSRCEAVPPKEYQRMISSSRHISGQQMLQSTLTTPPNSPIPSEGAEHSLSWRHSALVKAHSYKTNVIFGLIVSNLITFILGSCIGYYLAKRIHGNQKSV